MEQKPVGLSNLANTGASKSFEELTEKEQIQRLREELISARYVYRRVCVLETEMEKLKRHQHGINGEVLVDVTYYSNSELAASPYDRLK